MGKARVKGVQVNLLLMSQTLLVPIMIGEVDEFKAKSTTEPIKTRPLGYVNEGLTLKYGGWNLSFQTGKADWSLVYYYWAQDQLLRGGKYIPEFYLTETITHFNGAVEQYTYKNVRLYGLDLERKIDEVNESIEGFSPVRVLGPINTTEFYDVIGAASIAAITNITSTKFGSDINSIERKI